MSQSHGVGLPVRLLADENIPNAVVRQLQRKYRGTVDAVRAYDAGLTGISDAELLAWDAQQERVVITRDKATLTRVAYQRMAQNLPMPGVIVVTRKVSMGRLLEDLSLIVECSSAEELANRVYYMP